MTGPDRTVRVFISSTFRDMHAERDHLVTVVFPELRERCEQLGLEFFDVDLRWGVPEKGVDGETANSWEYCRQWIDRVQPFFVCLLGQRYGWVPEPEKLKDESDRTRQEHDPRSITDMEVRYAVLEESERKRLSYFYLRTPTVPRPSADAPREQWELYGDFVDGEILENGFVEDPSAANKLTRLKKAVTECGRPARAYYCQWQGDHFSGMDAFGRAVFEDLWSAILRDPRYVTKAAWQEVLGVNPDNSPFYKQTEIPMEPALWKKLVEAAKPPLKNPLEAEREQMATFAASRLRWFRGRTNELKELIDFISDPADDQSSRLAVLAAVPGQGKSALMAKLASELSSPKKSIEGTKAFASFAPLCGQSLFLITHFVGATEQSSTAYALVKRLNNELDASGIVFPERPTPEGQPREESKLDFNSLCQRLYERLGNYDGSQRIVILLDALNQLSDGHELGWLPYRLGPGVRLVVSCIKESVGISLGVPPSGGHPDRVNAELRTPAQKVLTALKSRHPQPKIIPLGELREQDVRSIVTSHFEEYCKQLDPEHIDAICDAKRLPQARNPLYLLVMLSELRSLGGNDMNKVVPELIAGMATKFPDTVSLFAWVLQRMEDAEGFGREAVEAWCRYLALGRVGMASRELADLLERKFQSDEAALTAQRIERGLRRYLQRRGEMLDFFHGQLRQAVMGMYGGEKVICGAHIEIAEYFSDTANPNGEGPWSVEERHALSELPHHQIQAGVETWSKLIETLEALFFLEAKVAAGMAFELIRDFAVTLTVLPHDAGRDRLRLLEEALRRDIYFIARHAKDFPQGLFQCLWNSGWWYDCAEANCHFEDPKNGWKSPPSWKNDNPANSLSALLEKWRSERESAHPGFLWLRALRPPSVSLGSGQLAVLQGHDGYVTSVAFSPNNLFLLSGSYDKSLRLWDANSGECLAVLDGHEEGINSVAFSPDGSRLISGSGSSNSTDNTLRLWNVVGGECLLVLRGHEDYVSSVGFSPDGKRLLSGSKDKTIRIWNTTTGECLSIIQGHENWVTTAKFSPDGRRLLSGSKDKTLRLWDSNNGRCLSVMEGHGEMVTSVAFSPDGGRIVSGSGDKTLRLWDCASGECIAEMEGHDGVVNSVVFSADGQLVLSGSWDNTLRLWNASNGECLAVFLGHDWHVISVAFSVDNRRLLSGSTDMTLRLWDAQSRESFAVLEGHKRHINSVAFSPDGTRILSGSDDKTLRLWDAGSGECLAVLEGNEEGISVVTFSPDGCAVLSRSGDGTLRLWNAISKEYVAAMRGHKDHVWSVEFSPDGSRLLSGSMDKTLRLWDTSNGECLAVMRGHEGDVLTVAFSQDGRRLLSGSNDGTLRLWETSSGECLSVMRGHLSVNSIAFSPDDRYLLSGGWWDKTLRQWDAVSGECLAVLEGHQEGIDRVAFSMDGRHLLSADNLNTLVWDAQSGKCKETLQGWEHCSAFAAGASAVQWLTLILNGETIIQSASGRPLTARFPSRLHPSPVSDGRCWAGSNSNHLVIVKLEGGA